MRRSTLFPVAIVAVLALAGCEPKKSEPAASQPMPENASPTPEAAGAKAVTLADLPSSLRHDAFEYYGLGNEKTVDLEVKEPGQAARTGGSVFRIKEIKHGKALFEYEYLGGLAQQGVTTLSLEEDGIYTVSSSVAEVSEHALEMPADIGVGKEWKSDTTFKPKAGGGGLEYNATYRATKIEPIKTKAGSFPEALLVESSGPATINGEKVQMRTRMWFVKGRGIVKMENSRTPAGGKPILVTYEATS